MEELPRLTSKDITASTTTKEKILKNQTFWKDLLTTKASKEKTTYLTAEKASLKAKETMYKERIFKAEEETYHKLATVIEQIQALSQEKPLSKQTKQTLREPILNPGIYHINFFEHILTTLKDTKLESEKAETWKLVVAQKGEKRKTLKKASARIN